MKTAHQYLIALPENERTENVKAMVNIILFDAESDIEDSFNEGRDDCDCDDAYQSGYDEGYSDGHLTGFADGKAEKE